MAKFKVTARFISYGYVYVEAEDKDQAFEIASEMDGSEFIEYDWGYDWEDAQEIPNEVSC